MPLEFRNDITSEALKAVLHYDAETGIFTRLDKTKKGVGVRPNSAGYLRVRVCGVLYRAHRLAWLYHYGEWPSGEIDHINGIRTDNRVSNLRNVTHVENQNNLRRHREGRKPKRDRAIKGFRKKGTGAVYHVKQKDRWIARYKREYLGFFASKEAAEEAIQERLRK